MVVRTVENAENTDTTGSDERESTTEQPGPALSAKDREHVTALLRSRFGF